MRLTTKSRHAITAMLHLAQGDPQVPVSLSSIAESQNIAVSYLEQLFALLRGKGLVRGVRGPNGGYFLGHDASVISVASIIGSVDEWVEYSVNGDHRMSGAQHHREAVALWKAFSSQLYGFLNDIKLSDLVERGHNRSARMARGIGPLITASLTDQAA